MTEEQGRVIAEAYTTLRAVSRTMDKKVPAISLMCEVSMAKFRDQFPFLEALERLILLGENEFKKKGGPRPN